MRVVLVGTDLAPLVRGAGGLENVATTWADHLARRHEVHVISCATWPAGTNGVGGHARRGGRAQRWSVRTLEQLVHTVDRISPDVVVLNNRPGWAVFRWPTLIVLHNDGDALRGQAPGFGDQIPPAEGLQQAEAIVAVSDHLADQIRNQFGAGAEVIRPGCDPTLLRAASRTPAQTRTGVLFAGRLLRKKGVERLAEVAGHPMMAGVPLTVTRFISPWTTPTTEHRALLRVLEAVPQVRVIAPPAGRAALARLLSSASVAVVPSIWQEPLGMSSIEAQCVGTRVVASAAGGLPETIVPPSLVVDAADVDALAAALKDSLSSPMRANDIRNARARFSAGRSANRLCDLLAKVAAK